MINVNRTLTEKEYNEIIKLIISGCKFRYYSYDHKKALEEYNSSDKYNTVRGWIKNPDCHEMPPDLKEKYKTERIGKLREIQFAPNGRGYKFKIGAKYAKVYYIDDFGVNVFPIID